MVQLAPHDPEIRAIGVAHARAIENLFASRLSSAQRDGEIAKSKDVPAIARFLYHTLLGISVASRALDDHEALRETVSLAVQILD